MSKNTKEPKDSFTSIHITDSRPLLLNIRFWPVIAKATVEVDRNNQQLHRRSYITVRQHGVPLADDDTRTPMDYYGASKPGATALYPHEDQQCIVQATSETDFEGESGDTVGYLCTLDEAALFIRKAAERVGCPSHMIADAQGDLPPMAYPFPQAEEPERDWVIKRGGQIHPEH